MIDYIAVFLFYGSLLALFLTFIGPWTRFRVDLLRHKLFEIRDELFWYVYKHDDINHDTPAYCMTRTTINGMIRFADELTLGQLFIDYLVFKKHNILDQSYEHDFDIALSEISERHALRIDFALIKMHEAVLAHVIATSPLLCVIFLPSKIAAKLFPRKNTSVVRTLLSNVMKYITYLDAAANILGNAVVKPNACSVEGKVF